MAKITWTPWMAAMSLRLHQHGWPSTESPRPARRGRQAGAAVWQPSIDVFLSAEGLTLVADLPGIAREDLHLEMEGRSLLLTGERRVPQLPEGAAEGGMYQIMERPNGPFARSLTLPVGLDVAAASAVLRDGLLTIRIPRAQGCCNRRIQVCCPGDQGE